MADWLGQARACTLQRRCGTSTARWPGFSSSSPCLLLRAPLPEIVADDDGGPARRRSAWRRAWLGSRKQLVGLEVPVRQRGRDALVRVRPAARGRRRLRETDADGATRADGNTGGTSAPAVARAVAARLLQHAARLVEYDKLPSARTRDDCDEAAGLCLTGRYCVPPHAIMQGCSIGGFALAIAIVLTSSSLSATATAS